MFIRLVTILEISRIIKQLNNTTVTGYFSIQSFADLISLISLYPRVPSLVLAKYPKITPIQGYKFQDKSQGY